MKFKDRNIFVGLGGTNKVGASCYYLKIGGQNILLDCGSGRLNEVNFSPPFNALLQTPYLQDLNQISQVFISHGHLDHVGALPDFLSLNSYANIYMTDITWQITKLQMRNKISAVAQDRIVTVDFSQQIPLNNVEVSFYRAGHIPGAMMIFFKYGGKTLLYTGDYSTFATQLVEAVILPKEKIDTLIICGLHARHPYYRANDSSLTKIIRRIQSALYLGRTAFCRISQISKGIELLTLINKFLPNVEIFIDKPIMNLIYSFEQLKIPVMKAQDHPLDYFSEKPGVILSVFKPPPYFWNYEIIPCDFSLHDDFNATVEFVEKINPKTCIVVHSPPDKKYFSDFTIEQALITSPDSRTNFIFPEDFTPIEF
ncbi:MAG: MBL fold metallo-hydrolase [Selenomonadaceae bacterium]|nr:MBL fold metallo-hydrolase [Selenomonadaceae bacterium]